LGVGSRREGSRRRRAARVGGFGRGLGNWVWESPPEDCAGGGRLAGVGNRVWESVRENPRRRRAARGGGAGSRVWGRRLKTRAGAERARGPGQPVAPRASTCYPGAAACALPPLAEAPSALSVVYFCTARRRWPYWAAGSGPPAAPSRPAASRRSRGAVEGSGCGASGPGGSCVSGAEGGDAVASLSQD
jgi:hypothetical protein